MQNEIQTTLTRAVMRLLRPLVRILLRNGISYGSFSDLAKKVYTDVAFEEFGLEGKKQTVSRVSILTGLTRKEVKRLLELNDPDNLTEERRYNRAIRVIGGWLNDPLYCDDDGSPRPLVLEGNEPSFSSLVRQYSGDVPTQAMLNELIAARSVEQRDDVIVLVRHAYIPSGDAIEKLHILGTDVEELIATIDHNLTHEGNHLRFQRKVSNPYISTKTLKAFKELSSAEAQMLLERLDAWLSEHEINEADRAHDKPVRVCLGIYYYEDSSEEEST